MAPGGTPAFNPVVGLPGGRSALLITTAAYADAQLAWLRPPVSGAHDLAAALTDPRAGGFSVDMLTDGTETEIRLAIGRFLSGRSPDETVLLYLACHAIRDRARLYFAATDTWLRYPQRSALPAAVVLGELDRCGAGSRLLILDCCFSGGFAEEKGELDVATELALDGRGVAVLSGSRAREYSYEGRPISQELPRSVFTEGLAVGLATGDADADGNGIVTVAEAYNYAYRYVSQHTPRQAPQYYLEEGQGEIVLARARPRTHPQARLNLTGPPAGPRPAAPGGLREPGNAARRPDAPAAPAPPGSHAGPPPAHAGPPPAHAGPPPARSGMPPAHAGPPPAHSGMPPAHAGPPPAHSGMPPAHAGPPPARAVPRSPAPPAAPPGPAQASAAHATTDASALIVEQDRDNAYCVVFSPDGRLLASGGWGRPVRVRDALAGGLVRELKSAGPSIYDLAFSPDGALIATGGRDGTVGLCEVGTGKKLRSRKPGGAAVRAVAFSPDGTTLLSAHEDGVARLWDVPALGRTRELRADGETMFAAVFSPDGTLVAAACADGAIRVWSTVGGDLLTALRRHTGWATAVTFTPDGSRLVSAGADGTVQFHSVVTGEPSGVLRAGDGIINAITLSPDGTLAAAGYETGAVTVWEIASSRYETLVGHAGHVNDVVFSPHARALASAGKDGTVRLWR
jgi:Caspase domain/WD domain, G-beta repeat